MYIFVSVRGHVENPTLLIIDLSNKKIIEEIPFPLLDMSFVPSPKRGFAGLYLKDQYLYAATWDRVCVINKNSMKIEAVYTDSRFSDLHGLKIDDKGDIWVTNTNLDGVFCISNGTIEPVWYSWERDKLRPKLEWVEEDYRQKVKQSSPYHYFHINDCVRVKNYLILSHLGYSRKQSIFRRLKQNLGLERRFYKIGGYFILDYSSKRLIKRIRTEGLHDSYLLDGNILSTEYFGNRILQLDYNTFRVRSIPLEIAPHYESGYLTRGILQYNDSYWVGHTVHNGWTKRIPAKLRNYSLAGKWLEQEIELPNYVGAYSLVACD
jgi:hypothetical protein